MVSVVLISSPRQVLQHHIVTPADTLDDPDADANIGNGARDRTLPFRHLMCIAVRAVFFFVVDLS